MIEGLQILPWLQSATRSDPTAVAHLGDCGRCQRMFDARTRQGMGCAYEAPSAHAVPWQGAYDGPALTTCPGYTTKLPEVSEASWARFYLHKGSLQLWCRGELHDRLAEGVQLLELASNAEESARLKRKE